MSATTTRAPARERRSAMANPMPRAPPVTIATLPGSSKNTIRLLSIAHHTVTILCVRRHPTEQGNPKPPYIVSKGRSLTNSAAIREGGAVEGNPNESAEVLALHFPSHQDLHASAV